MSSSSIGLTDGRGADVRSAVDTEVRPQERPAVRGWAAPIERWRADGGWSLLTASLFVVPVVCSELTTYRIGLIVCTAMAVLGLHVLVHWADQLSLAHAAFMGLPALVAARLAAQPSPDLPLAVTLPVAVGVGVALGAVVGVAAARVRGIQVAIVTLVVGVAVDRFLFTKEWLVGTSALTLPSIQLGPFALTDARALYPLVAVVFAALVLLTRALEGSKVHRAMLLTREDNGLAAASGVASGHYRLFAYSYAGALAGIAGLFHGYLATRIGATSFTFSDSLLLLTIVIVAGRGSLAGSMVATALFVARDIPDWLPPVALLLVVTRWPGGLNDLGRRLRVRIRTRSAADPAAGSAE